MNNYKETKQPKFWKKDPLSHYAIIIEVNITDVKIHIMSQHIKPQKGDGSNTDGQHNKIKSPER